MVAVEVRLLGGPADGRLQPVESDAAGALPGYVTLPQAGLFVGAADKPAPRVDHMYRQVDDIDSLPIYQYESTRSRPFPPASTGGPAGR
jgi:hypothetical protein